MSGSCLILSSLVNDFVPMLNELLSFTYKLKRFQGFENLRSKNRFLRNSSNKLLSICFDNNQLDGMGIISNMLALCFAVIPFVLPPIVFYMNTDVNFYIFQYVFLYQSSSTLLKVIVFCLRSIIVFLCTVEANSICNLSIILVFMFTLCRKCIQCLCSASYPYIRGYRALRILFIIANQFCSLLFSLYLGMTFYFIIICVTMSVVVAGQVSWTLYVFFPVFGGMAITIVAIMLYLLVFMGDDCSRLRNKWVWYCGMELSQHREKLEIKIFIKTWKSLKNIGYSYGSWGTITKATRTDYFGSLVNYSMNAILACRDFF